MRKKLLFLAIIINSLIGACMPAWAGVQDFSFSDFSADYYLSKDSDGISHLQVVENLVAEFPETRKQNKGICRQIPYTNQGGANLTLGPLTRDNIKVFRNGAAEPIYSIELYGGHYEVCTGTEEYVFGTTIYTFVYEFDKVVTLGNGGQELYWDTNGNGWSQRFGQLTARVHFEDLDDFDGESWCYVGAYGESGQSRCKMERIEDGVEFTTGALRPGENLTFVVGIKPGTFVIPEPEVSYVLVIVMIGAVVAAGLLLIIPLKKYMKSRGKAKIYHDTFVKPEYQPDNRYTVAEMAEVFIGKKKDGKVALLLDMIVKKKIAMVKSETDSNKTQWKIVVNDAEALEGEEKTLLKILNGGSEIENGSEINIKTRAATASLAGLASSYRAKILSRLWRDKLVESSYKIRDGQNYTGTWNVVISSLFYLLVFGFVGFGMVAAVLEESDFSMNFLIGKRVVGADLFLPVMLMIVAGVIVIWVTLNVKASKYRDHTEAGLKASRYMDGLKLYIGMAESERLKMLQSVKGADTSAKGIVKLYEKLLPYAAVFGLEESWMNELKEYCKVQEIVEPDYLLTGVGVSDLSRSVRGAASVATSSTHYVSRSVSGGGSWSSGSSGGGGGGFSGGGGGGGGGGGR